MTHPMIRLLARHPQWLVEHAQAYAELAALECRSATQVWSKRALLWGVAAITFLLAAALAGVALMLAATLPRDQMHAPWALVLVPAVPAVATAVCLVLLRMGSAQAAFHHLRLQVKADADMLREVSRT